MKRLGFVISAHVCKYFGMRYHLFHKIKPSFCCRFTWTKDDKPFDLSDPRVIVSNNSGTFKIPNEGPISHFQGRYRCFAANELGVALSEEMEFIVPSEYPSGGPCPASPSLGGRRSGRGGSSPL